MIRTYLLLIDFKRPLALTVRTVADGDLLTCILIERTQDRTTLATVEFDIFQLWKDAAAASHDARHADKIVEVHPT